MRRVLTASLILCCLAPLMGAKEPIEASLRVVRDAAAI